MGLNKVMLIGNLGQDPETRYALSGTAVTTFGLATNENYTNKAGERQERTEWHRVVCFGKLGEIVRDNLSKGRQVYVEGRLQTRTWEDKNGLKHHSTEIVASMVQFLGPRPQGAKTKPAAEGGEATPAEAGRDANDGPGMDRPDPDEAQID